MSTVNVQTNASAVGGNGIGVLLGVGAVVGTLVYTSLESAAKFRNVARSALLLASVILAVVLYLMLTDVGKLTNLIGNNQLVALVLTCLVAADVALHGMVEFGIIAARA